MLYTWRWIFVLDNVRAYTAGCFEQCFLSFRFALPSLLQEGERAPDQLLRERDNARYGSSCKSGCAGERVEKRKRIRGRGSVPWWWTVKGIRSLRTRRYDFSFSNHGAIILRDKWCSARAQRECLHNPLKINRVAPARWLPPSSSPRALLPILAFGSTGQLLFFFFVTLSHSIIFFNLTICYF